MSDSRARLGVGGQERLDDGIGAEALGDEAPGVLAETPAELLIVEKPEDRLGERVRIVPLDHETGLAVDDLFGDPAGARADGRASGGAGFERDARKRLWADRGHDDEISGPVEGVHRVVRYAPEPADVRERGRGRAAVAGEQEHRVGPRAGHV